MLCYCCDWFGSVMGALIRNPQEHFMKRQKETWSRFCMLINFRRGRTIRRTRNWIFHIYTKPCELKDEVVLKPPKTCSCIGLGGVHGTAIVGLCPNESKRKSILIIMRVSPWCTLASGSKVISNLEWRNWWFCFLSTKRLITCLFFFLSPLKIDHSYLNCFY